MEANHTGGNASIHTTCECSDRYIALIIADSGISIHAAREGGDQTTAHPPPPTAISIHAAREGGDSVAMGSPSSSMHFNPRRP